MAPNLTSLPFPLAGPILQTLIKLAGKLTLVIIPNSRTDASLNKELFMVDN